MTREETKRIVSDLVAVSEEKTIRAVESGQDGEECIFGVIQSALEMTQALPPGNSSTSMGSQGLLAETSLPPPPKPHLGHLVLRIDHMNDHGTYTRKLMRWGIELGLFGSIHYRLSSYSKNKAWCRAEDAYLLVGGSEADVGELVTRIRTQKMTRHDTHDKRKSV